MSQNRTSHDPASMGFSEGIPSHSIVLCESYEHFGSAYLETACKCGFTFRGRLTKSGKGSTYSISAFRNHLQEMTADPDEENLIGKFEKTHLTFMLKVIHRNHPIVAEAAEYSKPFFKKNWLAADASSYWQQHGWTILIERFSKKGTKLKVPFKLAGVYRSREYAISKAIDYLNKQAEKGFTVDHSLSSIPTQVLPSFGNTLSNMLTLADDAMAGGELADVVAAIEDLDSAISFFDVIKSRREELARIKQQRTVGLLK